MKSYVLCKGPRGYRRRHAACLGMLALLVLAIAWEPWAKISIDSKISPIQTRLSMQPDEHVDGIVRKVQVMIDENRVRDDGNGGGESSEHVSQVRNAGNDVKEAEAEQEMEGDDEEEAKEGEGDEEEKGQGEFEVERPVSDTQEEDSKEGGEGKTILGEGGDERDDQGNFDSRLHAIEAVNKSEDVHIVEESNRAQAGAVTVRGAVDNEGESKGKDGHMVSHLEHTAPRAPQSSQPKYQNSSNLSEQNLRCANLLDESHATIANSSMRLRKAWATFVKDVNASSIQYCMARCSAQRCCAEGRVRGLQGVEILKDDLSLLALADNNRKEIRKEAGQSHSEQPIYLSAVDGDIMEAHKTGTGRPASASSSLYPSLSLTKGGDDDVTLITQGTIDRLKNMDHLNAVWPGPKVVVFAIYNSSADDAPIANAHRTSILRAAAGWTNVRVLFCTLRAKYDFFTKEFPEKKHVLLPINTLRNLGIDNAQTNYVFPLDIDFIPSRHLYSKLIRTYLPLVHGIDRVTLVLPHYETLKCDGKVRVPHTFSELQIQLEQGHAQPFHVSTTFLIPLDWPSTPRSCEREGNNIWTPGIKTTNYNRWYRESREGCEGIFPLKTQGGPQADRYYEPFTVFRRVEADSRRVPRYPEQFVGRFKNKIAFITLLRAHRYRFFTVRKEFVIHIPHKISNQSTPEMESLLLTMRKWHLLERSHLAHRVYSLKGDKHPGKPQSGPLDHGFICNEA